MFEFGSIIEIFFIFLAALLLLGPKEIPVVFNFLGKVAYKIKYMTSGFRDYIDHHMQVGELDAFTKDSFARASSRDSEVIKDIDHGIDVESAESVVDDHNDRGNLK